MTLAIISSLKKNPFNPEETVGERCVYGKSQYEMLSDTILHSNKDINLKFLFRNFSKEKVSILNSYFLNEEEESNFLDSSTIFSLSIDNGEEIGLSSQLKDEILSLNDDEKILLISADLALIESGSISRILNNLNDDKIFYRENLLAITAKLMKELLKNIVHFPVTLRELKEILLSRQELKVISEYVYLDPTELLSFSNYLEREEAELSLRKKINLCHLSKGVILENSENTYIDQTVSIGIGTFIANGVRITGDTSIGKNCVLLGSTRVSDSKIEDGVRIESSVIEESHMKKNSNIGPFSHLRPKSIIGESVHLGNFIEVKNSTLDTGTKAGHLAYMGDADIGKNVNISCGVIFANYDGKKKHRTIVEDNAFIGSNVNLVAPVEVAESAFIAAGSTITKYVPKEALAIERAQQVNKEGYVARKRSK